jgi:hypothetical protein
MTDALLSILLPTLASRWSSTFRAYDLPAPVAAELLPLGGGAKTPGVPVAPGEHRPLPLDAAGGVAYVRRDGPLEIVPSTSPTRNGCGRKLTLTLPLRVVAVADVTEWTCRDRPVGEVVGERLLAAVSVAGVPITDLGTNPKFTPQKLDDDAVRIFTDELGEAVPLPARRAVAVLVGTLTLTYDPTCVDPCPAPR